MKSEIEEYKQQVKMGTILENLSGKKLSILVSTLLLMQLTCFLIGGLIGKIIKKVFLLYLFEFVF